MNILFLTMNNFESISEHSIYPDLIRELASRGNYVTVLSPIEKRQKTETNEIKVGNIRNIKVQTGNLFNVNMIEKAISRAGVCRKFKNALRKYCNNEGFDLVLYSTPPTTLTPIIKKVKDSGAYAFLMLKDIFPQNAVDLGMIRKNGLLYHFFRLGEKKIYKISDKIGCMSPANIEYIKEQDQWIDPEKLTICPNAIEVRDNGISMNEKSFILDKYKIPRDKILFVYGGSLGKPQGIDFLISCLKKARFDEDIFFVILGNGSYYDDLKNLEKEIPNSLRIIKWLPVDEYEVIVQSCNVGLVMLNHKFLIPNFPSRILLYMQAHLPILAATDPNTDIGKIAENNGFGLWCESNNEVDFLKMVSKMKDEQKRKEMGQKSFEYLQKYYSVEKVADKILAFEER